MFELTLSPEAAAEAPSSDSFDLIILGGGPAGLTAGLYAARGLLKTLLIERGVPGGQAAVTFHIENFPGFAEGISGAELGQRMHDQARHFGLEFWSAEITGVSLDGPDKVVTTDKGVFHSRAVILATGAKSNDLGVPGEEQYKGRGVSYCATCDGAFFRDQTVAVVGGGDSAIDEAIYLTRFAKEVIVIHRRNALRATRILQERAKANPKIRFQWDSVVDEIGGGGMVEWVTVRNVKTGEKTKLPVDGVFIYVGLRPTTEFLAGSVALDAHGHVLANEEMETSVPGVFAAGDLRVKNLRQVVTACADGAIAAVNADKYLQEQHS